MTEYVIRIRVVTERQPRDDIKWEVASDTVKQLFKARPSGALDIVGLSFEQVEHGQPARH